MKTLVYEVAVTKESDGRWSAECPALPGCATWGDSERDALKNVREAVEAYVEDLVKAGETVPAGREIIQVPAVSVMTA